MTDIGSHRFATVNGVRLHYVEAGSGPLVLLLHGFPEFWYSWRHQIPALAAAGFRVLAPDLRGYFTFLGRLLTRDPVKPGAFAAEDIEAYKRALAQPGALTATINYYRAALRRHPRTILREVHPIDVPTLLIWGERDRHLGVR